MKKIKATITLEYSEEQIRAYAEHAGWNEFVPPKPEIQYELGEDGKPVEVIPEPVETPPDRSFIEAAKERLLFIIAKDFKGMNLTRYQQAGASAQSQVDAAIEASIASGLSINVEELQ